MRRRSPLPVLISILIIGLAVGGAAFFFQRYAATSDRMDRAAYYGLSSASEVPLIVNDTILESKGRTFDGAVYLDFDTVYRTFHSGFTFEQATNSLLLTEPDGTTVWTVGDGTNCLRIENGTAYVLASCVSEHSEADIEILEDPVRLVARNRWDNLSAMQVTSDGEVRYRGGPKSEILTDVSEGDIVVLLERLDDWYKVSTADGFLGYIETKKLAEAPQGAIARKSSPLPAFPHIFAENKICLGWQYVGSFEGNDALEELTADAPALNVVAPTWFHFADEQGTIESFAQKDYVDRAHAAGLSVWGVLQDVSGQDDLGELFATRERRESIIRQLLSEAETTGMDGLNLDLETLREEDAPAYLQFIKEICVEAHARGLVVSTDNYVPLYTRYYNHAELARTVDYLVVMCYDEHTSLSSEAGSVASLPFMEQGIHDMLELVPAEQIVAGIPFFTRGWTQTFGEEGVTSQACGMIDAEEFVSEHGIQTVWDASVGQHVGSAETEDARYSIWMEDLDSIEEKMKVIRKQDLAGVAAWRLGFEKSGVWQVIGNYLGEG